MPIFKRVAACTAAIFSIMALEAAAAETIVSVTDYHYDMALRQDCVAVRMNSTAFGTEPQNACDLTTIGVQGPDRIAKTVYDDAGRILQIQQGVGISPAESPGQGFLRAYSTLAYSPSGMVTDSIDANGNRTTMTYDGFDRLSAINYPKTERPQSFSPLTPQTALATAGQANAPVNNIGGDYETFKYDGNGNRTEWRRRSGEVLKFSYDNLNRETRQYHAIDPQTGPWSDETRKLHTVRELHTIYDLTGAVLHKRFDSASGPGVSYVYDAIGRVKETTDINARTVKYKYNVASARNELKFHDNATQSYSLDALNRVTNTSVGSANLTMTYNSLGQPTGIERGNGTTTSIGRDSVGRVKTYDHNLAGTGYDASWTFSYSLSSQINSIVAGANANTFAYHEKRADPDGRSYDGLNRDVGIAQLYEGPVNAKVYIGYDSQGNLTNDGTRSMKYDLYNRLKAVTGNGANVTFTYDTEGRLSSYDNNSVRTEFLYDGTNLIAEYKAGVFVRRYVHGFGTDQPLIQFNGASTTDASLIRYLYTNYQGSVIATAGNDGYKSEIYRYGPYGEPRNGFNEISFSGESRFRYTGQTVLPDVGLYYYKARVYDPAMGRFLQTDPIGTEDDLNLYAYTGGDPVNGTDPTGTEGIADGVRNAIGTFANAFKAPATPEEVQSGGGSQAQINQAHFQTQNHKAGVWMMEKEKTGLEIASIGMMPAGAASRVSGGTLFRFMRAFAADEAGSLSLWSSVKASQGVLGNTIIPKSFELTAGNTKVWVHPNATKHLAEYATSMSNRGVSQELVNLGVQAEIESLQAAVSSAVGPNGLPLDVLIRTGGWELKFGAPRAQGQLEVLFHAIPLR